MAMKWTTLLKQEELYPVEDKKPENKPIRTIFDRDYDRIIYSTAFRRLGRKTQVHPLSENDHVHNRLSHTLETTTVGRSLGRIIEDKLKDSTNLKHNLDADDKEALRHIPNIMVAACLAHDMGNPPFGHIGEDIISEHIRRGKSKFPHIFTNLKGEETLDLEHFEGNAQTFRILTHLEIYKKEGGLRLSMPTLATTIKYPWGVNGKNGKNGKASSGASKFNYYQSEKTEFDKLAETLGMKDDNGTPCRHPLSYLLEAADDICYLIMDFEDALDVGIISVEQFKEKLTKLYDKLGVEGSIDSKTPQHIRGGLIDKLTHRAADIFMENYDEIMSGTYKGNDLLGNEQSKLSIAKELGDIRKFFKDNVYNWGRNERIDIGAYQIIGDLIYYALEKLDNHLATTPKGDDGQGRTKLSKKMGSVMGINEIIDEIIDNEIKDKVGGYEAVRMVLDYISGMTDNFAVDMQKTIRGNNL